MSQVSVETFEAYGRYLDQRPDEPVVLFNTIRVNVTAFLRDPEAWQVLGNEISAGCSSGEERRRCILGAHNLTTTAGPVRPAPGPG